jgi:hypothetical protein
MGSSLGRVRGGRGRFGLLILGHIFVVEKRGKVIGAVNR